MQSHPFRAALPLIMVLATACESSTGLSGCNLPPETVSVTTTAPSVTGVVERLKVGGIGTTPEGYNPWAQVDAFVWIPVNDGSARVTVDIILGKGIPVLLQQSGALPRPTSACRIRVGDRVTLWAPLQGVTAAGLVGPLGDTVSLNDAAFLAQKLIIEVGT
jgi:hypothetical protein